MSDGPQRKVFTTVEANFLEAGVQMDEAAQKEAALMQADFEDGSSPSLWTRVATGARRRRGIVALTSAGVFAIGLALLRAGSGSASADSRLTVAVATPVPGAVGTPLSAETDPIAQGNRDAPSVQPAHHEIASTHTGIASDEHRIEHR